MKDRKSLHRPQSRKQEMMLKAAAEVQCVVIGGAAGSGKSYLLQLMPLMLVDDPKSTCIMFRRTTPQLSGAGGIWDKAKSIMRELPIEYRPHVREKDKELIFPTYDENLKKSFDGMKIKFQHMQHEDDKLNIQGLEYTFIGVDEACQFEWSQLEYMLSRLRSGSKHFSRIVMSCNPDPDHKIRELIDWYLDEEGYPIPERDGVVRYFIRYDGDFYWGNSREELLEKFPSQAENCLSFTFVSATIDDNPVMKRENPSYKAFLEGLNPVDKAQLLYGNWNVRSTRETYFKRSNIVEVDKAPSDLLLARGWDLASQEISDIYKWADFSAGVKMGKSRDGYYYIMGDFCATNYDEHLKEFGRFRKRVKERDDIIIEQGLHDGKDCVIVLPNEPAAAGKLAYEEMAKKLINAGLRPKKDPTAANADKLKRFTPFADAVESGLVRVVTSTFDKKSLESFYKELERFCGERSGKTENQKDDRVDGCATAFNYLTANRVVKTTRRKQRKIPTALTKKTSMFA